VNKTRGYVAEDLSKEIQESNELFISTWHRFAESFPSADIIRRGGLVIGWPDVPLPFYNNIFLTGTVDSQAILAARAGEAAKFARTKAAPGVITVCHDLLSGVARTEVDAIFKNEGYVPAMPLTGMAGDLLPLAAPGHAALHIERAKNDGVVVTDINCVAYGFARELGRASLPEATLWQTAFPYVAFEGERPVATASTLVIGECLFLALVATMPDARGKGYAQAVVRQSLQRAHEATGYRRTILHATDAGRPVYERIGYHATSRFTFYMAQPHE
jgi:GNAT superfamily N-acetyltransferase